LESVDACCSVDGPAFLCLRAIARWLETWAVVVLGGDDGRRMHDVWASDDDGRTWSIMTFTHTREKRYSMYLEQAEWTPRASFQAVADKDGLLTLTAGATDGESGDPYSADVWQLPAPLAEDMEWYEKKTKDDRLNMATVPLAWSLAADPPWTGRYGHAAFIDGDGVPHIVGGEDKKDLKNGIWKMAMSFDVNNLKSMYERTTEMALGMGLFSDGSDTSEGTENATNGSGKDELPNATADNTTNGSNETGNTTDVGNMSENTANLSNAANNTTEGSNETKNTTEGSNAKENTTNVSNTTDNTTEGSNTTDNITEGSNETDNTTNVSNETDNTTEGGNETDNTTNVSNATENTTNVSNDTGNNTTEGGNAAARDRV